MPGEAAERLEQTREIASPSAERLAEAPRPARNLSIDGMRVLAAASVVMIHVSAEYAVAVPRFDVLFVDGLAQWAMPFFFALAGFLHARSRTALAAPGRWRRSRLLRLGVPYAAWSAVYVAYSTMVSLQAGRGVPPWKAVTVVFMGGANSTLWFLPALLYAGVAVSFTRGTRSLAALAAVAAFADVVVFARLLPLPASVFLLRMPLAFLSYAAGYVLSSAPEAISARLRGPSAVAAALVAIASAAAFAWSGTNAGPSAEVVNALAIHGYFAAGTLVFVWAASRPDAGPLRRLAPLAPLAMGVYLVHTLLAKEAALRWPPASAGPLVWLALAYPAVLVLSAVITAALRATPVLGRVVD